MSSLLRNISVSDFLILSEASQQLPENVPQKAIGLHNTSFEGIELLEISASAENESGATADEIPWRVEIQTILSVGLPVSFRMVGTAYTIDFLYKKLWLTLCDRFTTGVVAIYDTSIVHFNGLILGRMFSNISGLSFGYGMASALSIFATQNHAAGESHKNGAILHLCAKVLVVVFVLAMLFAIFCDDILNLLEQPNRVIPPTTMVTRILLLSLPAQWATFALNCLIDSQEVAGLTPWAMSFIAFIYAVVVYSLLNLSFPYEIVPVGRVLSCYANCGLVVFLIYHRKLSRTTWQRNDEETISMWTFFKTACPSALSIWFEWSGSEILGLLCGFLHNAEVELSAHGILFNISAIVYMVWWGVGIGASTRVSNLLSSNQAKCIPRAVSAALVAALMLWCVMLLFLIVFMDNIIAFCTLRVDVHIAVRRVWPALFATLFSYSISMTLAGVLRAGGGQWKTTIAFAIGYWVIGLPFSIYYGLVLKGGLKWIWYGNSLALFSAFCIMLREFDKIDWYALARYKNQVMFTSQSKENHIKTVRGDEDPLISRNNSNFASPP